jgi:hypothetical protein
MAKKDKIFYKIFIKLFAVMKIRCNFVSTNKGTELFKLQKFNKMINLNTITKEQFVSELIFSDDAAEFYNPREQQLLSLNFDFEEMKQDFENWIIENCDNK